MNLTSVSRDHFHCFQKHIPKLPTLNLSTSSIRLLSSIYRAIHRRRSSAITGESDEPVLAQLYTESPFAHIPQEVQREIRRMTYTKTYHLQIGDRTIRVVIAQHSKSLAICRRAILKIERWLSFILSVAPAKCANSLSIFLFFTDHKKVLPKEKDALFNGGDSHKDSFDPVDQIHANTAFTTSCSQNNSITIFRKEEWFKVLIHESFHCLGLDFSAMDAREPDNVIRSFFPILSPDIDIRLYETYCEMWAQIINLLFLCGPATIRCKSGKPNVTPASRKTVRNIELGVGFRCITRLLKYERIYSVFQANKLLQHYGLVYKDVFDSTKVYREKTQAFSYYVLKSILMWNIDGFIQWCLRNNHTPYSLEFDKSKMVAYAKLVGDKCRDSDYLSEMSKEYGVEKCKPTLVTTMRMCLFEGA